MIDAVLRSLQARLPALAATGSGSSEDGGEEDGVAGSGSGGDEVAVGVGVSGGGGADSFQAFMSGGAGPGTPATPHKQRRQPAGETPTRPS